MNFGKVAGLSGFLCLLLMAWGCSSSASESTVSTGTPEASSHRAFRLVSETTVTGLSGLTAHKGRYFAVAERDAKVIEFSLGSALKVESIAPIKELPPGFDVESVAYWPDGSLWVGLEGPAENRKSDELHRLVLRDGAWHSVGSLAISYGLWNFEAEGNRGLEGLCAFEDRLLVVAEQAHVNPDRVDQRRAPAAVVNPADGSVRPLWLPLTSKVGKLSAVACRVIDDETLEVFAIERHYEVGRLLRWQIDRYSEAVSAVTIVHNYGEQLEFAPNPNFEGLAFTAEGDLLLLADNSSGPVKEHAWVRLSTTPAP